MSIKNGSRKEWPLWAALLFDLIGFSFILIDLQLRAEDIGKKAGIENVGWIIGLILGSTFVIQTLVSPLWGRLGDRFGTKMAFTACTVLSAGSMAIYAFADSFGLMLLSRIIAGFGSANVAAAQAAVSARFEGANRTAALGRLGAAISTGLIIGPVFGGPIAEYWGQIPLGLIGCGLSLLGVLLVVFLADMPAGEFGQSTFSLAGKSLLKSFPAVIPMMTAAGVAWFSLAMLEGTFGRLLRVVLQQDSVHTEFGIVFGFESGVGLIIQAFLLKGIVTRFGTKKALLFSYLSMAAGLALWPLAPNFAFIFIPSIFFALGQGISSPTVSSACSHLVDEDRHGELFGLLQSARGIGFALGPVIGGILFDWGPRIPYFSAGAVCVISGLLIYRQQIPDHH
jgi:DHA1 family multidrug resistance protein-like MFS transporter